MAPAAKYWTREEVLALPDDGNRYELVDGELLVSPSPRPVHQRAVAALFRRVDPYVRRHRVGEALFSPADLDLDGRQLVQPDLFVVPVISRGAPRAWTDYGMPLLVAEVLSPETARDARFTKRRRFQRSGVPVYWIVDADARLVEVWTPDAERPTVVDRSLDWQPRVGIPPLVIELTAYFREIWTEGPVQDA